MFYFRLTSYWYKKINLSLNERKFACIYTITAVKQNIKQVKQKNTTRKRKRPDKFSQIEKKLISWQNRTIPSLKVSGNIKQHTNFNGVSSFIPLHFLTLSFTLYLTFTNNIQTSIIIHFLMDFRPLLGSRCLYYLVTKISFHFLLNMLIKDAWILLEWREA